MAEVRKREGDHMGEGLAWRANDPPTFISFAFARALPVETMKHAQPLRLRLSRHIHFQLFLQTSNHLRSDYYVMYY